MAGSMPAWAPSLVARHRCHGPKRSSPRRGRELEPRNGVLRSDSGPVVARFDAGERLMGSAQSEVPAPGPCWLPVGYRTPTAMVALARAADVGWGSQRRRPDINRWEPNATPRRGGQGSERSESENRRPEGEAKNGPTRRVTTVPPPRSADRDGRVGRGTKKVL